MIQLKTHDVHCLLSNIYTSIPETGSKISREEQEARIKAEKIKIAIEKIKEANVKKLFVKVKRKSKIKSTVQKIQNKISNFNSMADNFFCILGVLLRWLGQIVAGR